MYVQRKLRQSSDGFQHLKADTDVGDINTVHYVEMYKVGSRLFGSSDLRLDIRKISRKQTGRS